MIRSRSKKTIFDACVTCFELPSTIKAMGGLALCTASAYIKPYNIGTDGPYNHLDGICHCEKGPFNILVLYNLILSFATARH